MKISYFLKIKISGLNNTLSFKHWGTKANTAKKQRTLSAVSASNQIVAFGMQTSGKYVVNITRYGKKILDDDNLAGGCKHIRDGIADALGVDDGSRKIKFNYFQEKCSTYKLKIEIEEVK